MSHQAHALVSTCMDFRFQATIHKWLEDNNLYEDGHDRVSFAGSGGNLDLLMSQVRLSVKLHDIKEVHILNHQNCGYYGPTLVSGSVRELEIHSNDLKKAKDAVLNEFPNLKVHCYFVTLEHEVKRVEI